MRLNSNSGSWNSLCDPKTPIRRQYRCHEQRWSDPCDIAHRDHHYYPFVLVMPRSPIPRYWNSNEKPWYLSTFLHGFLPTKCSIPLQATHLKWTFTGIHPKTDALGACAQADYMAVSIQVYIFRKICLGASASVRTILRSSDYDTTLSSINSYVNLVSGSI